MKRAHILAIPFIIAMFLAGAASLTAKGNAHAAAAPQIEDCLACHPRSYTGEVHGMGINSPAFKTAWDGEGNPQKCLMCHVTNFDSATGEWKADVISCEACHNPLPEEHPDSNVPVDKSTDLCAKCHNDSRFGWADWKVSAHYKQEMTCNNCHDPHLPKRAPGEDVSVICEKCHEDISTRAEHSSHRQAGVTCIECHLGPKQSVDAYHKVPDHSFKPVLDTCISCHARQMHDAIPVVTLVPTETTIAITPTPTAAPIITATPSVPGSLNFPIAPFTSLDFAMLGAGLLGLGAVGGLAFSPILDYFNHLFSKKNK